MLCIIMLEILQPSLQYVYIHFSTANKKKINLKNGLSYTVNYTNLKKGLLQQNT